MELVVYEVLSFLPGPISKMFRSLGGHEWADRDRLTSISMLQPLKICSMSEFVHSWPGSDFWSCCLTGCCLEPTASSLLGVTVLETFYEVTCNIGMIPLSCLICRHG